MQTGHFTGFEVELRDPGIAWIKFNTPERLNGLTQAIKRDLVETVLQGPDSGADRRLGYIEMVRGAVEIARRGNFQKGAEVIDIHCRSTPGSGPSGASYRDSRLRIGLKFNFPVSTAGSGRHYFTVTQVQLAR